MENTNNQVDVAVGSYSFNLFQSHDEHTRNLIEINVRRMLRTFSRDPRVTPLLVEQFPINYIRFEIPKAVVSLPPWFDFFFLNVFIWIDMTLQSNLGSSQIDSLSSDLANYTRNWVIPNLQSSDADCFHLIADLTIIREFDHEEEMLPGNETEEEEEEIELGNGVAEFVLERLRKSSFLYKEKAHGGSLPMMKIGEGDECSVCLQEFCDAKNVSKLITCLPCGHVFHQECVFHWLQDRNTCPYCRGRVE